MDDLFFIFRLDEGPAARRRKRYLRSDGKWGVSRAGALRGSRRRMQALARKLRIAWSHLIIERAEPETGRGANANP